MTGIVDFVFLLFGAFDYWWWYYLAWSYIYRAVRSAVSSQKLERQCCISCTLCITDQRTFSFFSVGGKVDSLYTKMLSIRKVRLGFGLEYFYLILYWSSGIEIQVYYLSKLCQKWCLFNIHNYILFDLRPINEWKGNHNIFHDIENRNGIELTIINLKSLFPEFYLFCRYILLYNKGICIIEYLYLNKTGRYIFLNYRTNNSFIIQLPFIQKIR